MNEVYQQPFDVRTVMVLISHDHDRSVPEIFYVFILPAYLDAKDLNQVLNLWVLHDLLVGSLADI